MVSKISLILAKGETYTWENPDGTKIGLEIKPLDTADMMEMTQIVKTKGESAAQFHLLKKTLVQADPEVTDEEIRRIPMTVTVPILKVINRVNGMDGSIDFQEGGQNTTIETSQPASKSALLAELKARVTAAKQS